MAEIPKGSLVKGQKSNHYAKTVQKLYFLINVSNWLRKTKGELWDLFEEIILFSDKGDYSTYLW